MRSAGGCLERRRLPCGAQAAALRSAGGCLAERRRLPCGAQAAALRSAGGCLAKRRQLRLQRAAVNRYKRTALRRRDRSRPGPPVHQAVVPVCGATLQAASKAIPVDCSGDTPEQLRAASPLCLHDSPAAQALSHQLLRADRRTRLFKATGSSLYLTPCPNLAAEAAEAASAADAAEEAESSSSPSCAPATPCRNKHSATPPHSKTRDYLSLYFPVTLLSSHTLADRRQEALPS